MLPPIAAEEGLTLSAKGLQSLGVYGLYGTDFARELLRRIPRPAPGPAERPQIAEAYRRYWSELGATAPDPCERRY